MFVQWINEADVEFLVQLYLSCLEVVGFEWMMITYFIL